MTTTVQNKTVSETVDDALLAHACERLELLREALGCADNDAEHALAQVWELARRPLFYRYEDVAGDAVCGGFPVFEECEVYVPCDGLSDAEVISRATGALIEAGCDDVADEPPVITSWGHVLLLAEHTEDGDVMFWFHWVQPDERAVFMAHVVA